MQPSAKNRSDHRMQKIAKALKKCKNSKLTKKCFKLIAIPQKTVVLHFFYRIPGDILLEDDFPSIKFVEIFSTFRKCKKIMNVFVDKSKQIIGSQVINNYDCQPPFQLLVCRLQSLGDIYAYNLSLTIEKIIEHFKNISIAKRSISAEEIYMRPSYKKFLQDNDKLIEEYSKKYPVVMWRGSNFENSCNENIFEISFNYTFVKLIGEEIDSFAIKFFKKGMPKCIFREKNYFQMLDISLNNVFFLKKKEEEIDFLIKTGDQKIKVQRINIINRFQEDHFHECFIIQIFKVEQNNMYTLGFNEPNYLNDQKIVINNNRNKSRNVFLEKDNITEENLRIIKDYYPNLNIKILENLEEKEQLRCTIKKL